MTALAEANRAKEEMVGLCRERARLRYENRFFLTHEYVWYVCVYVYMHACMYVYVYMHECVCVCIYA